MLTYADPHLCPSCRTALPAQVAADHRCTTCDVSVGHPRAAEVFVALERVDTLVARLRAVSWAPAAAVGAPAGGTPAAGLPSVPPPPPPAPFVPFVPPMPPMPPPRTGVRTASVPAILLSLGALCLLVAAVTFLAVAWSWLGVGGRTAVLAAFTVATAAGGQVLAGRGLRIAAEALSTVALGLLVLDVFGAADAGWLGGGDDGLEGSTLGLAVGLVLAAGGALLAASRHRLAVPQVAAVAGLFLAQAALASAVDHDLLVAAVATVLLAGLAAAARTVDDLAVAAWVAAGAAVLTWLDLTSSALGAVDRLDSVTLTGLWSGGPGVALLAAALLLLAPCVVRRDEAVVQVSVTAAATSLTGLAVLPVLDNGTTEVALASLVTAALWTSVAYAVPRGRLAVPVVPAALSLLPGAVVALGLAAQAIASALSPAGTTGAGASTRLDPGELLAAPALLVPTVGVLAALLLALVPPATRRAAPAHVARLELAAALLAAVATLALHPVPLWTVVAALAFLAAAYVADALRRADTAALGQVLGAVTVLVATLAVAAPSDALLMVPLTLLAATATASLVAGRHPGAAELGGLLLPASLAASTWVLGGLAGLDDLRAVPVLVVAAAVALGRARPEAEVTAALAGAVAAVVAVTSADDVSLSLALHLTLAGALVVVHSLVHPSRRPVAWAGTVLLVLATWVRLADLGVDAPEPYTMPTAVLLVVVGLLRMRRDRSAATGLALLPGLLLATVPSLLHVVASDPVSLRAALLGLGCLVLAVGGAQLRWSAPLLVGAGVGGLLTLLELAPYAAQTPQWVAIGLAGTTLVVVGTTWERRVVELRRATHYVGRLR